MSLIMLLLNAILVTEVYKLSELSCKNYEKINAVEQEVENYKINHKPFLDEEMDLTYEWYYLERQKIITDKISSLYQEEIKASMNPKKKKRLIDLETEMQNCCVKQEQELKDKFEAFAHKRHAAKLEFEKTTPQAQKSYIEESILNTFNNF